MKEKLTFKIITFGCRTNQAESRFIGEKLINDTMRQSAFAEATVDKCDNETMTDVVIINTCCVTGKAEKEVRQAIRKVKRENPDCFLVVCGCFAENILRSSRRTVGASHMFSLIDLLVGNKSKERIDKILKKQFNHLTIQPFSNSIYQDKYSKSKKALVKIQDGCDNFCTYCIVPYLRGRSVSWPADKIIGEIKRLIKQGIKEVVLTGIDIASYKLKTKNEKLKTQIKNFKIDKLKNDLVKLIKLILATTNIKKISFGSMGVEVFDEEFINLYRKRRLGRVCKFSSPSIARRIKSNQTIISSALANIDGQRKFDTLPAPFPFTTHFHIPIQSGCKATLKRMGRKYKISNVNPSINLGLTLSGVEGVKLLISKLKKKIPNFTFSTDIMVGFPGETDEEFKESLRNIKEIKKILGKSFKKIHVFRYSSRKGTVATKMESSFAKATKDKQKWGRVDERTKKKRAFQMARITPSGS